MLSDEDYQVKLDREAAERETMREERRADRKMDRAEMSKESKKSFIKTSVISTFVLVITFCVFTAPMKVIDWSNCEDACEANGDESMWMISQGCFCKDDDGLYNPRDER